MMARSGSPMPTATTRLDLKRFIRVPDLDVADAWVAAIVLRLQESGRSLAEASSYIILERLPIRVFGRP